MIKLDKFVGDVIFISFRDVARLKDVGIKKNGHYKLAGYDQLGLWLEHPGIIIQKLEDKSGRPLPLEEQVKERISANFMVHWDNINTLMHYPDRKGFDFDDAKANIGFKVIKEVD